MTMKRGIQEGTECRKIRKSRDGDMRWLVAQ